MTASEKRLLLPFLRDLANEIVPFPAPEAAKLLERFDRKPSEKKATAKREKQIRESAAKAAHAKETAAIRAAVFLRAGDACEFCGTNYHPREMHHLESGIGRRRQLQAVENCVAICGACHRAYHHIPEAFRDKVIVWAAHHGYRVPSRFSRPARPDTRRTPQGISSLESKP